jgi:LysR family transcriptional regulator for metE and metH
MERIADARPALEVRDLELALALAATGSTVKAASRLHLTQSAVSRALLAMEDRLGALLFERRARGLVPTAAGQRLVAGAGVLLAELGALEADARSPAAVTPLRVVCECYTAYRWLPSTLATLERSGAPLDVTLAFDHTAAPIAGLVAGEVDVALLTTSPAPRPFRELRLFSDEIVFVVAASHPLAAVKALEPADLRAHTLITSAQTPKAEARWFFARAFGRQVPRLKTLKFPMTEVMMDAARAGLGVAALSEWIALPYLAVGDLVVKRMKGRDLKRPWRMAFAREKEAAARTLASAIAGAVPKLR